MVALDLNAPPRWRSTAYSPDSCTSPRLWAVCWRIRFWVNVARFMREAFSWLWDNSVWLHRISTWRMRVSVNSCSTWAWDCSWSATGSLSPTFRQLLEPCTRIMIHERTPRSLFSIWASTWAPSWLPSFVVPLVNKLAGNTALEPPVLGCS